MTDHHEIADLPAPAGSLELYKFFNREEMQQFRRRCDEIMAEAVYRSLKIHD